MKNRKTKYCLLSFCLLLITALTASACGSEKVSNDSSEQETITIEVTGRAMEDTLFDGEKVTVVPISGMPNNGDIIVASKGEKYNNPIVKRVIAVGGQTLRFDYENDKLFVNGKELNEPYIKGTTFSDKKCDDYIALDDNNSFVVPENKVFVLGDNRLISLDSRSEKIGLIDSGNIIGVVQLPESKSPARSFSVTGKNASLTLAESPGDLSGAKELTAVFSNDYTNITYDWIPKDIDEQDGDHSGDNYFAYTFYCKNNGRSPVDYNAEMSVSDATKGVDEALRVMIYKNGSAEIFAKAKTDDRTQPEKNTSAFVSDTVVMKADNTLAAGKTDKYTVVIWIEGDDPDCLDEIRGGSFNASVTLS